MGVLPVCDVSATAIGASRGEVGQQDLVGHLDSVLLWLSEVGMLPTSLVGGPFACVSEDDVMERARRLVTHLSTKKASQGSHGKGPGSGHNEETQKTDHPSLTPPVEGQMAPASG
ncbi:hypothetical protein NDU88_000885 [Pleurodeles waltl]|uniref:Uncharacterized protein n=1 Tax=Pleurodeles waltl TaxID=8319 RepID=A0AAV7KN22_PLEWA|nr:hypothetical protein NDU88_000885 [Pleurodeles waltl]